MIFLFNVAEPFFIRCGVFNHRLTGFINLFFMFVLWQDSNAIPIQQNCYSMRVCVIQWYMWPIFGVLANKAWPKGSVGDPVKVSLGWRRLVVCVPNVHHWYLQRGSTDTHALFEWHSLAFTWSIMSRIFNIINVQVRRDLALRRGIARLPIRTISSTSRKNNDRWDPFSFILEDTSIH